MSLFHVFSNHICIYIYIFIQICLHISTYVHTLVLNLGEPVILSFLCCILQGGVPVEAGVGVAGAVEAGPSGAVGTVDGNDLSKKKRTWRIED